MTLADMGELSTDHRARLDWFVSRTNQVVPWSVLSNIEPRLVTAAKGIYKPEGWPYALSVRQTIASPYGDRPPVKRPDGSWLYGYHAEEDPHGSPDLYTNRSLEACRVDGVPVAVLRQISGKPSATYIVDGLARVVDFEEGFFLLAGPFGSTTTHPGTAAIERALLAAQETTAGEEFDPKNIIDARDRIMATIVRRRGQVAFRNVLLAAYGGRCAMTGCDVPEVLEAAHIVPYLGPETNRAPNGLLLRADVHTLFDFGLLAIEPGSRTIHVAHSLRQTPYAILQGTPITEPSPAAARPSSDALTHHLERSALKPGMLESAPPRASIADTP